MCEIPSALTEHSSGDHDLVVKQQETSLSDGVTNENISNNMDISQDHTEDASNSHNVQEISGFTGVDIIALQNSATPQVSLYIKMVNPPPSTGLLVHNAI